MVREERYTTKRRPPLKLTALFLCALVCVCRLSAQEGISAFSASLGVEANNYSRDLLGLGGRAGMDIRLGEMFSLGASFLYALDLGFSKREEWEPSMTVMELSLAPRFYFLRSKAMRDYYFIWQNYLHWFIQLDAGFSVMSVETVKVANFLIGGTFGARLYKNNFFVEPYVRGGYPVMWGVGFLFGYRFTGQD